MPAETNLIARAILFDMDGTLVDSTPIIHRAWQWWTSQHGLPLAPVLAVERGRPNREIIAQFAPELDAELESQRFVAFEEDDTDGLAIIPGADAAVRAAEAGPWGVVTSARRTLAEVRLRASGFPVPRVLVSADMIARGKPEPDGFILAAQRLDVPPAECVVFEDSMAGIESAKRAGMRAICVGPVVAAQQMADFRVADFRQVSITRNGSESFTIGIR